MKKGKKIPQSLLLRIDTLQQQYANNGCNGNFQLGQQQQTASSNPPMYIQPPRCTHKGPNGNALVIELYKHEDEKLSEFFNTEC